MLVLGVHGGDKLDYEEDPIGYALHDSAAVLLKNGEVIAAIEEERLDRIKHSNCFPTQAIRFCLEQGACELRDLDLIATNRSAAHVGLAAKFRALQDSSYRGPSTANGLFSAPFQKVFGQDVTGKLFFCEHHLAHAWSAYALSGFEDCLLLSIDGDGDNGSGLLLTAQDGNIQRLREFSIPQSLGLLYENLIRIIGYGRFEEYKAMGLAPYGDPERFRSWFQDCYTLLPEGNYELKPIVNWFLRFDSAGLLKVARRRGEPFLQEHKDFAAALQACVETIVLHVLHHYQAETGQRKLCIAGGVGHNCSANGLILRSGLFQEVFVQPAAHDAGGALGAAICATRERSSLFKPHKLTHVYWGTDIPADDEVVKVLRNWGLMLTFTRQENIAQTAARLLAEGNVLGVLQGRSEFGPRALGNRSILRMPALPKIKLE
jgi:carbamoyltransferase